MTEKKQLELTEQQKALIAFERQYFRHPGIKEDAARKLFGVSATRYAQMLNATLDLEAALAYDPATVKRLRRIRERGSRRRPSAL